MYIVNVYCFQLKDLLRCFDAITHLAQTNLSCANVMQEWHVIEEIVKVLHIPFEVTTRMETSTLTLSDVFGILLKMEYKIEKLISGSTQCTQLAENLQNKVAARKSKLLISPALLCSVYLDPRYCLDLCANEKKVAKLTLDHFYKKLTERTRSIQDEAQISGSNDDSYEKYRSAKRKCVMAAGNDESQLSEEDSIMLLLEEYEMNLPNMLDQDSILDHWECRKNSDPILYQVASMVNSIAPTEVTVERAFSILSLVYNSRRTRLSPNLLQQILLIKLNKDLVTAINAEDMAKLSASMQGNRCK